MTTGLVWFKIWSLILSAVVIGLGLHSHYASSWVQKVDVYGVSIELYKICNANHTEGLGDFSYEFCPDIAMELYFVVVIITCFAVTFNSLLTEFSNNIKSRAVVYLDTGFHIIGGVALLIAGIVYMLSAFLISNLMDDDNFDGADWEELGIQQKLHFRSLEKRVAAVCAIMQGGYYLSMARIILRNTPRGDTRGTPHVVVAHPITVQANLSSEVFPQQENAVYGFEHPPPYQQNTDYEFSPPPAYSQAVASDEVNARAEPALGAGNPSYGFNSDIRQFNSYAF